MEERKRENLYYERALIYLEEKDYSKAINILEKACNIKDKEEDSLNLLGLVYLKKGYFKRAREVFLKSLRLKEEENRAKIYLDFLNSKDFKEGEEAYLKALEEILRKNYKEALVLLKSLEPLSFRPVDLELLISLIYCLLYTSTSPRD